MDLIDLNELPRDEICDHIHKDVIDLNTDSNSNEPELANVKLSQGEDENYFEPFIGQCFLSEEEAFKFYEMYARRRGFSIRRGQFIKKDGLMIRRGFFCHREGFPVEKFLDPSKQQRNKESLRCGCKAVMRIKLKRSFEIFPEEWHVVQFVSEHNHELLLAEQVRFLSSYRTISKEDEHQILLYKEAGLSVKQIMRVMELQKNVNHGDLPFLSKDIYNFFNKIRQGNLGDDAMRFLNSCQHAKEEDSRFQYAFTLDEQNRLEHMFWAPTHCFGWYQSYGDAFAFDTTYKVNFYDMPFGIFVGIDNNGRTILLGCALLRNETMATFRWLMKTFVTLMKKPPKTIITDQDPWMTEAISIEMPLTKHAFCIWHITSKFSGCFTSILRHLYFAWCSNFYRLYRLDNIDDFEKEWPLMVSKYNLQENKHVMGLYKVKEHWVPAYLRGYVFGGMTTTGRPESINSFLKRYTSNRSCLAQLIKEVDLAIEDISLTKLRHTMLDTYRGACLRTLSPLEAQVHRMFTNFAFKKFQEEFGKEIQYKVHELNPTVFMLQHFEGPLSQRHKVFWDGVVTTCSCKNFEFWGIICRHVLSLLLHKDCYKIPAAYLPLRWCRDEYHTFGVSSMPIQESYTGERSSNGNPRNGSNDFIRCPPSSTTKGRPRTKRARGGKELAKQVRACGFCKRSGHNITTCPEKENIESENGSSTGTRKKKKKGGGGTL